MYWARIITAVRKEVKNCDTFQCTKRKNIKYGELPAKESEEIPQKNLCVYIIVPYVIRRKVRKYNLNLKDVTMIDHVTGWSKITQFDDKKQYKSQNY